MYERPEIRPNSEDSNEEKISYLMDTRGFSRADAEQILAIRELPDRQLPSNESKRQYPSSGTRRVYGRRGRPRVGEDSQDVMTGIHSAEQVAINVRGIALAREALKVTAAKPTAQELAMARAREEKRNRKYL